MEVIIAVTSGFAAALISPLVVRLFGRHAGRILCCVPLALTVYFAARTSSILDGHFPTVSFVWIPAFGFTQSLRIDGLALLMALLIEGLGTLVFLYAGRYLENDQRLGRFFAWLFVFKASMLGLVVSGDLLSLLVFWELTSISSFMLIGHASEEETSRRSALQALLITFGGGQALLVGIVLLSVVTGTVSLDALAASAEELRQSPLYLPILLLVLTGAVTKSAQVPFHVWLPNAMAAPTPVSAFLHSATMVKAGVFLLLRMHPVLGGTAEWTFLVGGFGLLTLVCAAWLGLAKSDLKQLLAYATVAALGALVLLIGVGTPEAIYAALVFLLGHALYKGSLFLTAGAIDHGAGTREENRLSGLAGKMPLTALAGVAAAASMMGLLPALGFIGKEQLYEVALHEHPALAALTTVAFVAMGALAVATGIRPFFGRRSEAAEGAHEGSFDLLAGPLLLAFAGVALGLFPSPVAALVNAAASAVQRETVFEKVQLWHGLNLALLLSVASLLLGVLLFVVRARVKPRLSRAPLRRFGPDRIYDLALAALEWLARRQTAVLQTGQLRIYTAIVLVALAVLVVVPLTLFPPDSSPAFDELQLHELAPLIVAAVGAVATILTRSMATAVVCLGAVGLAESTLYLFFSAPDLALAQVVVQILTLTFMALLIARRPELFKTFGTPKLMPAIVAAAAAAAITALLFHAIDGPPHRELAEAFGAKSVPEGHGRNIVNVILVDFRSIDTLGEVAMLMLAGVGVLTLMRFGTRERRQ